MKATSKAATLLEEAEGDPIFMPALMDPRSPVVEATAGKKAKAPRKAPAPPKKAPAPQKAQVEKKTKAPRKATPKKSQESKPKETTRPSAAPAPKKKKSGADKGERALQEIEELQETTNLLIPRVPFDSLVRLIIQEIQAEEKKRYQITLNAAAEGGYTVDPDIRREIPSTYNLEKGAIDALQTAAEAYITQLCNAGEHLVERQAKKTYSPDDLKFVETLMHRPYRLA